MIDKSNYNDYIKKKTPNSPIVKDCICAFVIGGLICMLGQAITDLLKYIGIGADNVKRLSPVILIFIGCLLTGLGLYDKLGKIAGGGTIIPITGFANSIASSAIEFKKEGWVMGLGTKMFTVAGPVIVYGTVASVVYGIIYWIFEMIKA